MTSSAATKPTLILIHGAWHWAGCLTKLANELGAKGFSVLLPDLASHGYSAAAYTEVDSMATYSASVAKMIEAASEPVVLVGHSMGGATLTYLAERYPTKIAKLFYLTAFMTSAGKTPNDFIFSPAYTSDPVAADIFKILSPTADGQGVAMDGKQADFVRNTFYADCSERDVAVAMANIHPVNSGVPFGTPPVSTAARFGSIPRVYIECTNDRAIPIAIQRAMQADVPGAKVVTMETGHSPFFSEPALLANLLVENL